MKKELILIAILSLFVCMLGFSNETPKSPKTRAIIVSGKITDLNNNESLAGVKITCGDCKKPVYSDLNGNFFIYLELTSDINLTLEFSQIGYSSKVINLEELQSNGSNLSIDLTAE